MTTTADVLVIGGGGSGLSAAISAATSGATVILLEKCPKVGGSTAMSVGSFTAANTSYQYRAGVNDSIELFVADMKVANGQFEDRENKELRRILAENAGTTVEWLSSIGVQFLGPTPEPPYEKPRMHNVLPNSSAYASALLRECKKRGVEVRTSMRVDKLLRNAAGEIIGARANGTDFFGRRGVILATGDYSASTEMKAEFVGEAAAKIPPVNPNNTGDGFKLGTDAGGVMIQMDRLYEGLRFAPSTRPDPIKILPSHPLLSKAMRLVVERLPKKLLAYVIRGALTSWVGPNNTMYQAGAILIGHSGKRIANEDSDKLMARAAAADEKNTAFMIFDERVAKKFSAWPHPVSTFPGVAYAYVDDYKRFRPDVYHRAETIEELAASIGVATSVLKSTVDEWNAEVANGKDSRFGRQHLGDGVSEGPFCALGPMNAYITLADGGLAVDTQLRVTQADGEAIPGLWAAGSTGQGGLQLLNHGLHIGWAMVSGRLAGRNVAHAPDRLDLQSVETAAEYSAGTRVPPLGDGMTGRLASRCERDRKPAS
ncbi:FAD-dependent oxidoreductase [Arthrobacter sp. MMS18-M83]|uniref:FAD-dependent oxidoreductase n=1 Tax=Arthrobacter sp. MMS18-M83 TaxID=2996261 RepID=UPI00227A3271|nr:FAD-dependent oxidoreductase [Arthrobacter sp. MMS18-M83]WAH97424.1 FAD-dependent oxidoreductase [Arthrobacter sp. MMS18-M83]